MEMEMNSTWALKNANTRLTVGNNRWLYFDDTTKEWVVMEQGYRKRRASELIRTENEVTAVQTLLL